jgi:hypothetical protein
MIITAVPSAISTSTLSRSRAAADFLLASAPDVRDGRQGQLIHRERIIG